MANKIWLNLFLDNRRRLLQLTSRLLLFNWLEFSGKLISGKVAIASMRSLKVTGFWAFITPRHQENY